MQIRTDAEVRAATCPPDRKSVEFSVAGCPGLRLRVMRGGSRSWRFDHRETGKRALGSYPAVSLRDARAAADAARTEIHRSQTRSSWAELGLRVLAEREQRTLADLVADFEARRGQGLSGWAQQKRALAHRYGHLMQRPVARLTREDVLAPVLRDRNVAAARGRRQKHIMI